MRKLLIIACIATLLWSCTDEAQSQFLGSIEYVRVGEPCNNAVKQHWLIDLEASDGTDSIYLNTIKLNRKVELNKDLIDSNSNVFSLIKTTCVGDSITMFLTANEFYTSLGGSVPLFLDGDIRIKIKIWIRDALNPIEYLAHKRAYELQSIKQYLKKNHWRAAEDSATGIYYEMLMDFKAREEPFKKAKLKYTMMSLNQDLIANSKDGDPFIFDVNDRSVLLGIQFLAKMLTPGESLRAIIPSHQAFGPTGNSKVAGYTPILVELKLLEIVE
jgi:hypothetical protein